MESTRCAIGRRSFLGALSLAAAGCAVPRTSSVSGPIRLKKLGTFDIFIVEANPIVFKGKLVCFYSWGNQRGNEFSALAEADCTEREFCESFFADGAAEGPGVKACI